MSAPSWGARFLSRVGLALIVTAVALLILPFLVRVSPFIAAPASGILALGVLLVTEAVFLDTARGRVRLPGWTVSFGPPETTAADPDSTRGVTARAVADPSARVAFTAEEPCDSGPVTPGAAERFLGTTAQ